MKKAASGKRDRSAEIAKRRAAREEAAAIRRADELAAADKAKMIEQELAVLAVRSADEPADYDRDIDFAYKNSGNPLLTPLDAPSLGAWQWYVYARTLPEKFLEVTAKRNDAKAKQAGSVNSQRMEDDKRQQFAVIDRIKRQLKINVKEVIDDLMAKFPDDVLDECRKHKEQWRDYFQRFPLTEEES